MQSVVPHEHHGNKLKNAIDAPTLFPAPLFDEPQRFPDGIGACGSPAAGTRTSQMCGDPQHVCYQITHGKGGKQDKAIKTNLRAGGFFKKLVDRFAQAFSFGVCVSNTETDLAKWCPEAIRTLYFPPPMRGMEGMKRACTIDEITACFTGQCLVEGSPQSEEHLLHWDIYSEVYSRFVGVWGWPAGENVCKPDQCKIVAH